MQIGVFGSTGYAGRELVRLLRSHPEARLAFATGSDPALPSHEEGLEREADAYFLALPHGVAALYAARLRTERPAAKIVDLSGDLRLADAATYREWYGGEHPAPELLGQVPYGLPELGREPLRGAPLISNPGCYATSMLLPLAPLLEERLVDPDDVVIDSKSGATGAGRAPKENLLFCEVSEDLSAYSPGRRHRHVAEVERVLEARCGRELRLTFCPHLLPVRRGILSAIYLKSSRPAAELRAALERRYAGEPFVKVVDQPPRLVDVAYTNDCRLSVHDAAPGRVVVVSALDNLIKGASGQAIQNLNLALGLPEAHGLEAAA
jgi:N-acetyl-gamma-glutamyl-phosphate reductase